MRLQAFAAALLLVGTVSCDKTLSLAPASEVTEESAIVDAASARSALAGAYDALQDGDYYGGGLLFYSDMLSQDVQHTGTFSDFAAADANRVLPDNEELLAIYAAIYKAVGVANQLIARVPSVPGISPPTATTSSARRTSSARCRSTTR